MSSSDLALLYPHACNFSFVSTNDSAGWSSGSPVINRDAKNVGVIFDGNDQSLAGHFSCEATHNRAISVDARAIIETLKKIYGLKVLADELESSRITRKKFAREKREGPERNLRTVVWN